MLDAVIRSGNAVADSQRHVVPLKEWLAARDASLGVTLAPEDDPALLIDDLDRLALIVVQFPKFTDGRGYSTAVLLRRAGYRGELRAAGDVGLDQLTYLARCGFDAFALKPGLDPQAARAHLRDFRDPYQGAIDDPTPLFRRRNRPQIHGH